MMRAFRSLKSTLRDIRRWRHATADFGSWAQVAADVLRLKMGGQVTNKERSIRLRAGKTVYYRLNKGDVWSMREVLLDQCYRFPGEICPEVVLDLGGNIGLTSLWLDSCFQPRKLVAVEPFSENARLARKNLAQSTCEALVIEAAAGSSDGFADFSAAVDSNRGSVSFGTDGKTRVVSMATLFKEAGIGPQIDLLKVDIEGGEAELFSKNLAWLDGVQNIIVEFHPDIIDVGPITRAICSRGFRHILPGTVFHHNMEAFVRL